MNPALSQAEAILRLSRNDQRAASADLEQLRTLVNALKADLAFGTALGVLSAARNIYPDEAWIQEDQGFCARAQAEAIASLAQPVPAFEDLKSMVKILKEHLEFVLARKVLIPARPLNPEPK